MPGKVNDVLMAAGAAHLERRADFVCERAAPDGLAALALAGGVAGLDHEALYAAVEENIVVVAGGGEGEEVLCGLGDGLAEELELGRVS